MERARSGRIRMLADLATQIGKNQLMRSAAIRRWRLRRPRSVAKDVGSDEFLRLYAFASLDLLLEHIGTLDGRSVLEIGPGDHLASGLCLLAAGARSYTAIDRFPGELSGEVSKHWYSEVEHNWNRFYPRLNWPDWLRPDAFPEAYPDRVDVIGRPLEQVRISRRFDVICSFQVAEHLSNIQAFADVHGRILSDDGIGLHRVDFGPHDCWFYYRDPATFLRFSDRVWNLTGSNRGVPNRKRHHEFLQAFENAGLEVELLYRDEFDRNAIDLSKLHRKFRDMPLESVLTGTAIYKLTRKP